METIDQGMHLLTTNTHFTCLRWVGAMDDYATCVPNLRYPRVEASGKIGFESNVPGMNLVDMGTHLYG